MWNLDQIVIVTSVVVGVIVFVGALLLAGGNMKAALVFMIGLMLGVATLLVDHPNTLSILLACVFILAGVWLMNIIRIREDQKKSQKQ